MSKTVIQLDDVHKTYQVGPSEVRALDGVSLEVVRSATRRLTPRELWRLKQQED